MKPDFTLVLRLSSRRQWLRRAYARSWFHVGTAFGGVWRQDDGGTGALFPMRIGIRDAMQEARTSVSRTWDGSAFEQRSERRDLEVIRYTTETFYPDGIPPEMPDGVERRPSTWVARIDPVAIRQRFGELDVDAAAGWILTSRDVDCAGCQPVGGALGVGWRDRGDHPDLWQLRAERTAYLAIDDRIAVEDRTSLHHRRERERLTLRFDAFAAVTRTDPVEAGAEITGGAAAGVDVPLRGGFDLTVDVELARSYYARLDGDPAPVPEPAARVAAALQRPFDLGDRR